jgi:hypothetical protein
MNAMNADNFKLKTCIGRSIDTPLLALPARAGYCSPFSEFYRRLSAFIGG